MRSAERGVPLLLNAFDNAEHLCKLARTQSQVAAGFRELAELLRKQSTFDMAESYARQSCSIFQRLQGETSADALQSQCLLVCILRDAGR